MQTAIQKTSRLKSYKRLYFNDLKIKASKL